MELRSDRARATRDIDLSLPDGNFLGLKVEEVLGVALQRELQNQVPKDLGDFFQFVISEPILDLEAAPYGGARFHIEARLDERTFAKFHLDVGVGDAILKPLDVLKSHDWLAFAGIPPVSYPTLSKEQQFAEKIHAYTLPRDENRSNSRVKDLVDLLLLIQSNELDRSRLRAALEATFKQRKTHLLPTKFPDPPSNWEKPFQQLAKEVGLDENLAAGVKIVRRFFRETT